MRNVKLIATWANYVKGQWAAVTDRIAENLIAKGIAIDPTRPKPEPEVAPAKSKPKAAKKKVAKVKKHPKTRRL